MSLLILSLFYLQGVGIAFGPDVTKRWCTANQVTGIFRSHEVRQGMHTAKVHQVLQKLNCQLDGYAIEHDGLCTTVSTLPPFKLFDRAYDVLLGILGAQLCRPKWQQRRFRKSCFSLLNRI